jgi:hypothetical protein
MKAIVMGIAALVLAGATKAQEFLEVPIPKISAKTVELGSPPKQMIRQPWWKLDKDVTVLGTVHSAAAIMDGITTRRCIVIGTTEADPVDRLFLGPKPTWPRMIVFGSMEIYGAAILAQRMKHSRFKVVRRLYLAPQIGLIAIHTYAGGNNVKILGFLRKEGY